MKSLSYFTLIGVMFFFSSRLLAKGEESPVNIKIHVNGMAGGQAFLAGVYKNVQSKVDSAEMDITGTFRFQREEPY